MLKSLVVIVGLSVAGGAAAQPGPGRLHDALRLTPQQEIAWQAYQASIRPDPQEAARAQQAQMMMPTLPTPRRLALIRAQMLADQQTFDRNAQAVTAFYRLLTPDQQRIFDEQTAKQPGGARPGDGPG
jgi:hypothetical protein